MEIHPKVLAYPADQFGAARVGRRAQLILQVLVHFSGQFVRSLGSALAREQTLQAAGLELVLGLIDGRTRESKILGGSSDRVSIAFECAQGFVFELEEIPRIEEIGVLKEALTDEIRSGVEGSAGLEGIALGRRRSWHVCKCIYAQYFHRPFESQ